MSSIKNQTILGSAFSYLGIAVGFVTQGLLIGKYFSLTERSVIELILAISLPLSILANLGFNGAANRFFPYFKNKETNNSSFLEWSVLISIIGFIFVAILLYFTWPLLVVFFKTSPNFLSHFYLVLPVIFAFVFFNVFDNYSKALKDAASGTFIQAFLQRFINLILVSICVAGIINFEKYLLLLVGSYLFMMLIMLVVALNKKDFQIRKSTFIFPISIKKDFFVYSSVSILTSISSQIVFQIDKLMLGGFKNETNVAIYGNAVLFATVVGTPALALMKSVVPIVAEAWKEKDFPKLFSIYKKSCITQFLIGTLLLIGIIANFHNVFAILQPEYEKGKWVIVLLGLAKLVDMATGINGVIISTSKYYVFDTVTFVILAIVTIFMNRWLIPLYGVNGAGIATLASISLYNFARYLFIYLKFGFQPFDFQFFKVFLIAGLVLALNYFLPVLDGNVFLILFDTCYRSILITVLFVALIFKFQISMDVNQLISNTLNKFKRQ